MPSCRHRRQEGRQTHSVCESVPRPARPRNSWSCTLYTCRQHTRARRGQDLQCISETSAAAIYSRCACDICCDHTRVRLHDGETEGGLPIYSTGIMRDAMPHLFVVCRQRLKLHAKAQVGADGKALVSRHGHNCRSIVLEDLCSTQRQVSTAARLQCGNAASPADPTQTTQIPVRHSQMDCMQ